MAVAEESPPTSAESLSRIFLAFFKLGITAFGGPAMVAHIGELAIRKKRWVSEKSFQHGVALCQSLPGATAMQTVAYVGLRARGILGAAAAYIGFGLPAFLLMLLLAAVYERAEGVPGFLSVFTGLRVIVVAIVADAAWSFGRRSLQGYRDVFLALGVAAFLVSGGHPFVAVGAAILSGFAIYGGAVQPDLSVSEPASGKDGRPLLFVLLAVLVAALTLSLLLILAPQLFALACIMLKIDLFAFGGGFASVPLMLQEVVHVRHWLDSTTFMDGIALGQLTPGPIVITATFVGYLIAGLPGATVATLAIFTPSFVILVAAVPYLDRLQKSALFKRGTRGALVSFVGLLLAVTVKFALVAHWSGATVTIALLTFFALRRGINILWVVLAGVLVSALFVTN